MMGREDDEELQALRGAWRSVEKRWGLSGLETAMLLPLGRAMAVYPPDDTEHRMRLLVQVDYLLPYDGDDESLRGWLRRASPDLGDVSPLEVLAGPIAELGRIRRMLEAGKPS